MYILTEKKINIEGTEYTVYGIKYDDMFFIEDISADKTKVSELAENFNKYSLDPIQLYDVIEDFLA